MAGRHTRAVRVLVAEDEPLIQAAVRVVLERDPRVRVVDAVKTVDAAMDAIREVAPDVVLADLFLADGTACQLAERLRAHPLRVPLVVTARGGTGAAAAACFEAGAQLCLDEEGLAEHVVDAIVAVAAGRPWRGPGVVAPERGHAMVFCEAQVLALVASGLGDAEIADRLGYSRNYVKKILVSVRNRLGARDRAHAAALAATFGYVRATGTGRFAPGMATAMDAFAPLPHLYDVRDVLVDARPGREVHHAAAGGEA